MQVREKMISAERLPFIVAKRQGEETTSRPLTASEYVNKIAKKRNRRASKVFKAVMIGG